MSGFDIGKETIQNFSSQLGSTRKGTVFWNGPMGLFEKDVFSNGTINIAKSMALAYWRGVYNSDWWWGYYGRNEKSRCI